MAQNHEKAWRDAIEAALKVVGIEGLKRTSMFVLSSRRAAVKKAS